MIILLSAELFLPMRRFGLCLDIMMNSSVAGDKIFGILDAEEPKEGTVPFVPGGDIVCRQLRWSDEEGQEVLHGIDLTFKKGELTAVTGLNGREEAVLAQILAGRCRGYGGSVLVNGFELRDIKEPQLMKNVTYFGSQNYLFKGTIRDNLLMGRPTAGDWELWQALEKTNMADLLREKNGLDMVLAEQGADLSAGQRQRIALARAILHNSPVYIFDHAAADVDAKSEDDIMRVIRMLAETKTVIVFSGRQEGSAK